MGVVQVPRCQFLQFTVWDAVYLVHQRFFGAEPESSLNVCGRLSMVAREQLGTLLIALVL